MEAGAHTHAAVPPGLAAHKARGALLPGHGDSAHATAPQKGSHGILVESTMETRSPTLETSLVLHKPVSIF